MRCEKCGKEGAAMQCPKCKALGLPPSVFCEQKCFQAAWPTHKAKHSSPSVKSMSDLERKTFKFTGSVVPGLLTPSRTVPAAIPRPDYIGTPDGSSAAEEKSYNANRMFVWKGQDLVHIREVAQLSREVLEAGMAAVRPGVSTDEIDRVVHDATIERGLYPSPLGYNQFPKSVCTSVNEVICHGIPDSRELLPTDILNIDVSCYGTAGGFHGDLNETVFVAREAVTPETQRLLNSGYECTMAGFSAVRPGALYRHIGDTIAAKAAESNYSVVRSICGHGIGRLFHCAPVVPHYANSRTPGTMKLGHVFTIEPMVCQGTWEDVQWPDNWTIATKDGKLCAMFEHMCVVTPGGYELLTAGPDGGATYQPFFRRQLEAWGAAAEAKPPKKKEEAAEVDADTVSDV